MTNCLTCSADNICSSCSAGLSPSANGSTCVSCNVTNCANCFADNLCQNCDVNFQLVNGVCELCGTPFCLTCNNSSGNLTCQGCITGYLLTNGSCVPECTVAGCLSCSLPNTCTSCDVNFTLAVNLSTPYCAPNCGISNCISCNTSSNTCSLCLDTVSYTHLTLPTILLV